ncbi:cathepsin K-like [Rhinatrema bivittatum]|uniref:cathepsin K-like n=1 Tax=Rhinatrema bivittatum TaxID=194408 RepID=UPI001127D2D3|nr:cathepsin K-like [Rhinatrema bivittatum]
MQLQPSPEKRRFSVLLLPAVMSDLPDASLDAEWEQWKKTHNKQYKNKEEEQKRRLIWEKRLQEINTHNQEHAEGKHSYTMGMNQFGDMTPDELRNKCCARVPPQHHQA